MNLRPQSCARWLEYQGNPVGMRWIEELARPGSNSRAQCLQKQRLLALEPVPAPLPIRLLRDCQRNPITTPGLHLEQEGYDVIQAPESRGPSSAIMRQSDSNLDYNQFQYRKSWCEMN